MTNRKLLVSLVLLALIASAFLCIFAAAPVALAETNTVDVYAINDFHGAVDKMPKIAGFLAARKAEGAIIINSGDMFQGSMESNWNFGKLLTECMQKAGFDCMTYGNHEFDWGMDNLRNLAKNSGIPFLGANIYNWDRASGVGSFAYDFADKYIIKEVGDVKVGVMGVIGDDQITSINSQLVQTITFTNPLNEIRTLADELRNEKDCDIVVVSAHDGPQDIVEGSGDTYGKPTTSAGLAGKVDAMFCAHTHSQQDYVVDGIPFLQAKRYGDFVSHVRFSVNNGNVSVVTHENINYSDLNNVNSAVQTEVQQLIDNSNAQIANERNEVLADLSGGLQSGEQIPRLVCNAIANCAISQGYDVDLAMVNEARNALPSGEITYSDLYEAIPFDNTVYIAHVTGKDIHNEMKYGQSMWRLRKGNIKNDNTYYTIAVIDYLLFHQNKNRNYNYFPSAFAEGVEAPVPLTKQGVEIYNYRLITRDFLLGTNGVLDVTPYTEINGRTDGSKLEFAQPNLPDDPYAPALPGGPVYGGLPTYAIVLIVVGAVLVAAAVTVVVIWAIKRRKNAAGSGEE